MTPELRGLAATFRTTHQLFHKALEGLTSEQAAARPGGANPILWIAAHVVSIRASFATGLGANAAVPWAQQFPRGGKLEDVTEWPALAEVRARWDEVHAAFMGAIEPLTSEALAAETKVPGLDKTLLGAIALAALHDSYHVGQIAAARRLHGLDRIVG
jgi:uncharacterized damage-inducible protein DinB